MDDCLCSLTGIPLQYTDGDHYCSCLRESSVSRLMIQPNCDFALVLTRTYDLQQANSGAIFETPNGLLIGLAGEKASATSSLVMRSLVYDHGAGIITSIARVCAIRFSVVSLTAPYPVP